MAIQPVALDPAWPAMSLTEATERLTGPGSKFEMETLTINGVATRVWKNTPPSLPFLLTATRAYGERLVTVYEDERVTYDANFRATAALAGYLRGLGIGRGDRVAVAARNLPEWLVAFFAAAAAGAIAVPLNAWWTGGELAYALIDSGARVLIADGERHERLLPHYAELPGLGDVLVARATGLVEEHATRLEEVIGTPHDWATLPDAALPEVTIAPDDDATIFYTSGTTGEPKGAVGTHRNILSNILTSGFSSARSYLRRGEELPAPVPRIGLTVIPMFHVTACSAWTMSALATGGTTIFMRRWDPVRAMEIIERERVQLTGGVPTIAWQLLEHPDRGRYDLSSLEGITYGGAPAAPELVRRIYEEFGALPGSGWGMTETTATVTHHGAEEYLNRPDSAGPPVPVAELQIRGEDGVTLMPTGKVGELWCKGPMMARAYWNKPEASTETFVDGWVRTGDLARLDDEGFLFIVDRAKDMVIRGGENIYSSEVENCLYTYPGVTDCAVVGVPHRTLGEEPAAVVHMAPGATATEAELQAWVRGRLAAFKTPVAIRFSAETLPRNANGKILKKELRALFS